MRKTLLLAALFACSSLAPAVASTDADTADMVPDFAAYIPVFQFKGSTLTGHPYSAIETTQVLRTLPDGNEIKTESVQRLYRDSAGRVRKEKLNSNGGIQSIEITGADGAVYVLDPERKTMRKPAVVVLSMEQTPQGMTVKAGGDSAPREFVDGFNAAQSDASKTLSGFTSQDLGTRDIEGCKATGSASRHEMVAGAQGSSKPIEVTSENWHCRELGLMVYSKNSDALGGQRTTAISQISRSEPDAALFVVPADYTLLAQAVK